MPKNVAFTMFAIPELFLPVALHLDVSDLARCIRVCKAWSLHLEPILWTDFCPDRCLADSAKGTPSPPWTAALIRNLPHVWTVNLPEDNAALLRLLIQGSPTDPNTRCTNLKRVKLEESDYLKYTEGRSFYVATLLGLNPQLSHLNLAFEFLFDDEVMAALSQLELLQHLTVYSIEEFADSEPMCSLLRTCLHLPSLTELFIDVEWTGCYFEKSISDLESIINEASLARFSRNATAAKIKSLQPPVNLYGEENDSLLLLLLKSNLLDLRSCQIPYFSEHTDCEEIEQVVREHCPNLKDLTCSSSMACHRYRQTACAFLRGCSGVRSFSSERDYKDDSMVISTLVARHHHTLEVFEIKKGYCVRSNALQSVLSQCKHLRRFWVMDGHPYSTRFAIEFADICNDEWVCKDLKQLSLTLSRFPRSEYAMGVSSPYMDLDSKGAELVDDIEAARRVYTQIGRLEKLEVLALDIDRSDYAGARGREYAWDLTLSKGWLRELAGLKNLKSLILHAGFGSKMGQAEVEFIDEHWPLLREISLKRRASSWPTQAHWLWLIDRRPCLRFTPPAFE